MFGLKESAIHINRKVLSSLAISEPFSFKAIVDTVKSNSNVAPIRSPLQRLGLIHSTVAVQYENQKTKPKLAWNQSPLNANLGFQGIKLSQQTRMLNQSAKKTE
jgi:hypothetical protein